MKRIFIMVMMALIIAGGTGNMQAYAADAAEVRERIYEKREGFEAAQQAGNAIWKICVGVVSVGVAFKLGAIILGFVQGLRMGTKLKKENERKKKGGKIRDTVQRCYVPRNNPRKHTL